MAYDPGSGLINGANLVGGLIDQGQKTADYVSGLFDAHAKKQAGVAVAQGDYGTAAGLLGARGMLKEADAARAQGLTTDALTSFNSGNYAAAKTAAAKSGDPTLYTSINTAQDKEKQDRAAWMGHAADALLQIKDPAAREAAFKGQIAPVLKSMGVDDANIQQIDGSGLTDENLNTFKATLGQMSKMQISTDTEGNMLGVDPTTGNVKVLHKATPKPIVTSGGYLLPDGQGGWKFSTSPQIKTITNVDGSQSIVQVGGEGGAAAPADGAKASGKFEDFYSKYLAPAEGGYAANDGNGAPVNFGINQGANPDVSVKDLTPEKAKQLTYDRYWKPSGADALPAGLAEVQADTAFNMGIPAAQKLLKESGGDVQKYLDLREQRYKDIAAANPDKARFLPTWLARNQQLSDYVAGAKPEAPADAPAQVKELYRGSGDGTSLLNDDAVDYVAQQYVLTGQLPALGLGKIGTQNRVKVIDRAQKIEAETGATGADAVTRHLTLKSAGATLTDISKRQGQIRNFEQTAEANAELALSLAPKGAGPTASPVFNRWIQAGRKQVAGDADVAKFDAALGGFVSEYAKIISGSTSGSPSSDATQREAQDRINKTMNIQQLRGVVGVMRQEMANRLNGLESERQRQLAIIKSGGKEPQAAVVDAATGTDIPAPAYQAYISRFNAKKIDTRKPRGDKANPYLAHTDAELNGLPKGSYAIAPDGQYGVIN